MMLARRDVNMGHSFCINLSLVSGPCLKCIMLLYNWIHYRFYLTQPLMASKYTRGQWDKDRIVRSIKYTPKPRAKALMECVAFVSMGQRWFGDYGLNQLWPIIMIESVIINQKLIDRRLRVTAATLWWLHAWARFFANQPGPWGPWGLQGLRTFNYRQLLQWLSGQWPSPDHQHTNDKGTQWEECVCRGCP